jgi:hypothetical protein
VPFLFVTAACFANDRGMTVEELAASTENDPEPPESLSPDCQALWHAKAGNWDASHEIAQDITTSLGSWIHAHLHLIEGDTGNAGYWYARAGKPASNKARIPEEWREIAAVALSAPEH